MSRRTHVLLVHEDAPQAPAALAPFLRARLARRGALGRPWSWLGRLGTAIVAWWRARQLAPSFSLLPGPSPRADALSLQATCLERVLGRRYRCHPVLHGGHPDASSAAAAVGREDQVIIVPMDPLCGPILRAGASAARRSVRKTTDQVHWTGPWSSDPGYLEALAEALRLAIHHRPGAGPYCILFIANGTAESRLGERARRAAADVAHAAGVQGSWTLAFVPDLGMASTLAGDAPDAFDALDKASGTVVVQHLGATSESRDTCVTLDHVLGLAARKRGLSWARAAAPGTRPTFIHALAARVQTIEREVGWTVPEDRLRADVAAAWKAHDRQLEEE
ncbi:MAG: ferrochelatase [Myxococcota bacterium]|nr:ferrochelatase [Myxococcota bacterium]MEC8424644.1 ferrochelatase [Myxococcota bacterium]